MTDNKRDKHCKLYNYLFVLCLGNKDMTFITDLSQTQLIILLGRGERGMKYYPGSVSEEIQTITIVLSIEIWHLFGSNEDLVTYVLNKIREI